MNAFWVDRNLTSDLLDVAVYLFNDATEKPIRQIKWILPLDSIIKINVDGSSLSNFGRSGFGGLIRKNNGDWLLSFFGFCGILLLAWLPNCMSVFTIFVLRMMWAT